MTPGLEGRLAAIALLAFSGCGGSDLVIRHGTVYTADPAHSRARAVAVDHGRIVYVGDDAGVEGFVGRGTRVVDLAGGMLLPGFHDAHAHVLEGGYALALCNLSGILTKQEMLAKIQGYSAANPGSTWVVGSGWSLAAFPDGNPRREDLDGIVPDRPVFLMAEDGHSAWVNALALSQAGISRDTPDPPNGRIEHDPETGEPSGTLREAAVAAVQALAIDPGPLDALRGLRRGVAEANRAGITSFVEARSSNRSEDLVYEIADLLGLLHARVTLSLWLDPKRGDEQIDELVSRSRGLPFSRVRPRAVKLFLDGVIEDHTAFLLAPYANASTRGTPIFAPERLNALVTRLDAEGFQVHMHAIGDGAVRMGLDAVEAARRKNGPRDGRHQIAHLYLVSPDDLPRFRTLGVIADFQALWAFPDPYMKNLDFPAVGPERALRLLPIHSLVAAGARIAGGSDWPVSSIAPLSAIQVALTRQAPAGEGDEVLNPDERVDLETMLAAYTLEDAYLQHEDDVTGSIEVGKAADLVILDRNLFETPPREIGNAKVLLTFLAGDEVYRAGDGTE